MALIRTRFVARDTPNRDVAVRVMAREGGSL
jgi:hypothetical protein